LCKEHFQLRQIANESNSQDVDDSDTTDDMLFSDSNIEGHNEDVVHANTENVADETDILLDFERVDDKVPFM
jgi:hypothetical protein